MACRLGDIELVSELLQDASIKVNPSPDIVYPFHERSDDAEGVAPHYLGYPIQAAVRQGHLTIVRLLLERGSVFEQQAEDQTSGFTLIADAVRGRSPDVLTAILNMGFSYPLREKFAGTTAGNAFEDALRTAARTYNRLAFDTLLARNSGALPLSDAFLRYLLLFACDGNALEIAQALFTMNPLQDPNFDCEVLPGPTSRRQYPYACTVRNPLQLAARRGHMSLVRLLLGHGADPSYVEHDMPSPLVQATARGRVGCMKLLLDAGARMDFEDFEWVGLSLLITAVRGGSPAAVKLLLDRGIAYSTVEREGILGPLAHAHLEGVASVIKMLVEVGFDNDTALKDAKRHATENDLNNRRESFHGRVKTPVPLLLD